MAWEQATTIIQRNITVGTDLNTRRSTFRVVRQVDALIESRAYGYRGERGFIVSIGKSPSSVIEIPWSMLKLCYQEASNSHGYSGSVFRRLFPKQARVHPCHVHVVGRLFEVAGVARSDGEVYRAIV